MSRFTRGFLVPFLVLAIPLAVLAALGFVAAHRQLVRTREAAIARTVDAAVALVADYQESLRRETVLLARDPAVVEGTVRGDWATLARGASPRVLAVTQDGLADFITIRDRRGSPLVQVPASPPPSLPGAPVDSEPTLTLRLAGGRPYFLATASIAGAAERGGREAAGTVVAGRRLEGLAVLLDRLPARPAVVFLAGDRALAASRTDLPATGWTPAVATGATAVGADPFAVRRLEAPVVTSPDGALWVVLPVREFARAEQRLLVEFLALLAGAVVVLAGGVLAFLPRATPPHPAAGGPRGDSPRIVLERRNRELEALNAISATIGRGADLATTAEETLGVVRGLAGMDVGGVYRLDAAASELIMLAQSGFAPQYVERFRVRPLGDSHMGDAVRTGRILVTHLDAAPPSTELVRQMAAERAHRTQLAIPIPVDMKTWGVMALVSKEQREFSAEEMKILSGVAQTVGLAVERAQLQEMAAAHLRRLEAQRVIERHISEQLDTEELLVVIARSAQRLIGGAHAALYMLEGETLRPRAWSDVGDWIRDLRFKVDTGEAGAALATGRGKLINDYAGSPHAVAEFVPFTSRLLVAPLMAGARALGVMTAGRGPGAPPFTEEDLSILTDFATQAAVALEHARLFTEANRNAAQYQALLEVSGVVSSTLEVDRVLDVVVDRCRALLGVAAVGVMRVDRETGIVAYERGRGLSGEFIASLRIRLGEGTTGRAIERREAVWSDDLLHDPTLAISPEARVLIEREGYRAVLSVPLLGKDDAHGALAAYWWEPHTPSPGEISIMTALAGQAAVALENARLFAQERDRKASLSSLLEINKKIGALEAPEGLLTSIAEEAKRLLDVDNAGFRLLDGDDLVVAAVAGTAAETMAQTRIRVGESLSGKVLASGQTLMCELEGADVLADHLAAGQRLGYTHFLGVPLLVGERAIGVLVFRGRRPFTAREQDLAETFAGQAAIAIDHSRLYHEASAQAERMRAVAELGRELVSTLDEARVLELVATQARETLALPDLAIWLEQQHDGMLRLAVGQGKFSEPLAGAAQPLDLDEGVVGLALRDGRPAWTSDALNDPRVHLRPESRRWIEQIGGRAILAVPLIREHIKGALVAYRGRGERFTDREVEYLSVFANQLAAALENARLYEERSRAFGELADAQDQLVRTEKLRALGEMASGVAHDFNNVLASILGRAQLLLERIQDVKLRQWLKVIERAAMDGARTVRRLQDFTGIRRDQPAVAVDLNQVIQQVLETTESSWRQDSRRRGVDIEVVTDLAERLPQIAGDPAELREAFTNLVLNAVDAMPRGGTLTLCTTAADGEGLGGEVRVEVADTGTGIPDHIRQKIFDPFFTTKGPKGTGLGLSMAYGILARHSGRITVESEEGRGTTFRLVFPASDQVAEAAPPPASPAGSPVPLHCLVVDDEEEVAEVVADILTTAGHTAVIAGSGQAAVDRIGSERFDLVVTDLAMPGMTGWQVARAVKDRAPEVHVVMMSGFGVEVAPDELRTNGVDLVLAKPLQIHDVLTAVATILRLRGRSGDGRP